MLNKKKSETKRVHHMIPFIRSLRTGKANNEEAIRKGFNSVRGRSKGVRMTGKGVYGNFLDNGIYSIP